MRKNTGVHFYFFLSYLKKKFHKRKKDVWIPVPAEFAKLTWKSEWRTYLKLSKQNVIPVISSSSSFFLFFFESASRVTSTRNFLGVHTPRHEQVSFKPLPALVRGACRTYFLRRRLIAALRQTSRHKRAWWCCATVRNKRKNLTRGRFSEFPERISVEKY